MSELETQVQDALTSGRSFEVLWVGDKPHFNFSDNEFVAQDVDPDTKELVQLLIKSKWSFMCKVRYLYTAGRKPMDPAMKIVILGRQGAYSMDYLNVDGQVTYTLLRWEDIVAYGPFAVRLLSPTCPRKSISK